MLKAIAGIIFAILLFGGLFGLIPLSVFQQPLMIIGMIVLLLLLIFG